ELSLDPGSAGGGTEVTVRRAAGSFALGCGTWAARARSRPGDPGATRGGALLSTGGVRASRPDVAVSPPPAGRAEGPCAAGARTAASAPGFSPAGLSATAFWASDSSAVGFSAACLSAVGFSATGLSATAGARGTVDASGARAGRELGDAGPSDEARNT